MPWLKTLFYREDKNVLLLNITCLGWLFAKLMSWRIWTIDRLLPTVPLFESLDHVPAIIHSVLFALSLLLIISLFVKQNKLLLISLLVVEVCSCLLDQNRWMPWEYFYVFVLVVFIINAGNKKNIPSVVTFLLTSTYFYSGLCKLNEGYLQIVWTNMVLKGFLKIPPSIFTQSWLHYTGYLSGIIEMIAGVGLLFVKTRANSAKMLIVLHLFVLILLGPLGYSGYRVLWPWNIAMILFLYLIFFKDKESINVYTAITYRWNKLILICWGILPVLSFFGYWDKNLSSNLFSANLPRLIICVKDTSSCKPLQRFFLKKDIANTCHGQAKIDIQYWARIETNVAVYPEMRVYKALQQKLEKQYPASGLSFVYFTDWHNK